MINSHLHELIGSLLSETEIEKLMTEGLSHHERNFGDQQELSPIGEIFYKFYQRIDEEQRKAAATSNSQEQNRATALNDLKVVILGFYIYIETLNGWDFTSTGNDSLAHEYLDLLISLLEKMKNGIDALDDPQRTLSTSFELGDLLNMVLYQQ